MRSSAFAKFPAVIILFNIIAICCFAEPFSASDISLSVETTDKITPEEILTETIDDSGNKYILTDDLSLIPPKDPIYINNNESIGNKDNRLDLKLAAAALPALLIDKSFVREFPRTPSGEKSDIITETVDKFGKELLFAYTGMMYITGNNYDKESAKLTGTALVNAWTITNGLKALIHRDRPYLGTDDSEDPPSGITIRDNSFPSGHSAFAFAAATVLSERYPKRKWTYYAIAAGVGLARIRKSEHYLSDVLFGAGIGVYSGNRALKTGTQIFGIKF